MKSQLSLIEKGRDWKKLVNDPDSNFSSTMRDFPARLNRTCTGRPLPNVFQNPYRHFQQIFDQIIEGFDGTKSPRFEGRIREGLKSAWLETNTARSHLLYLVVCKLIPLATSCNEIQNALIEVFIKDEAHTPQKCLNKKWRLIWSLLFSDNVVCRMFLLSKNCVAQFQEDIPGVCCTGIGVGHHDSGLENLFCPSPERQARCH